MTDAERHAEDKRIRADFPLLEAYPRTAYLDNAATTQKPRAVLDAVRAYYTQDNANPLRGLYDLSIRATERYENAREDVRRFLHAKDASEIIFTRNATEGLNLVAYSFADTVLHEGDEILLSVMEHHSNLLPWQQAAKRNGAVLTFAECDGEGRISEEKFAACLTGKTRIVAMTQLSNVLGTLNDIRRFAALAHEKGAYFVADGAQSVPHLPVDVRALDVDFLAFSGHKMLAPMGIGALYGKKELLERMPPFLFGGEMIETVTRESATYAELPHKFEAGTVNAGGAAGLSAAIRYYEALGFEKLVEREERLSAYLFRRLSEIPCVHILGAGDAAAHHGIYAFTLDGVHPHDVAEILNTENIAIRAGHHCAQPLLKFMGTPSTARASLSFYNTEEEIDAFCDALSGIRARMGYV